MSNANGLIWYFAYGSNMNGKTLKRRRVDPKASVAVRVPGWRLTYDLRGFPFVEPAFADIEPLEAGDSTCPEVQGVCHQITVEEWERIVATEGGGGVAKHGYHSVHVDCIPLNQADKTPIRAVSLSVGNDPIMKHHGFLHLPSRRYVNLIIDGAKHYCLQDDYIQWLETHQSYDRKEHIKHKPIFYVAMAGLLFLAPPVFAFIALNVLFHRILPKLIYQKWAWLSHTTLRSIGNLAWTYHDTLYLLFGGLGWIKVHKGGNKNILCSPVAGCSAEVPVEASTANHSKL